MKRWIILVPVALLLAASCSPPQASSVVPAHATPLLTQSLDSVVSKYYSSIIKPSPNRLELSTLIKLQRDSGTCKMLVSNYFTRVLCVENPYVMIGSLKVYISTDSTTCRSEFFPGLSSNADTCHLPSVYEPLPFYHPPVWVYELTQGGLVAIEGTP